MGERTDQQGQQPTPRTAPTPGDIYIAAATAGHLAHCINCREQAERVEARYAEYGASIARRDRIQLGLHIAPRTAVSA